MQSPGGETVELFRNLKEYFFMNVQTVLDADLKIRDIVARWPRSTHDAHIFKNSTLYHRFETGHLGNSLLIGDSGYPLKPYLITPLLQANTEGKRSFNGSLIRTRNIVERAYGATKAFPCISLNIN
nr:unnamed protein product [Callosobruchus analis]